MDTARVAPGARSSPSLIPASLGFPAPDPNAQPTQTLAQDGNRPLVAKRLYTWKSELPRLTRATLERERTAFWDTAPTYEGRPEIWQALQLVCSADTSALAQAIVDSAQISVPTGRLSDGCYDILGNRYVIPVYCIQDPSNLVDEASTYDNHTLSPAESQSVKNPPTGSFDAQSARALPALSPPSGSLGEKLPQASSPRNPSQLGSTVPLARKSIIIRLSTGKDVKVPLLPSDTMAMVKAYVCQQERLDAVTTKVRFFHLGKPVEESIAPLSDDQLKTAKVIQALIVA
ncbi:hypothetical protein BJ085DRAFT_32601 [Dimargaris cristalligena]|uniref:DC-UbP/UBTD2 N-terminal domain-containing protein n=1 Tax=Dimargaris cristalligena TaxID=215637 RepID=A0A4Q0A2Y5_9FUNG|nr:hypothetical protein BJ085DRAFT_32601 [Dimargaris cristalligena]|eukprot:RKP39901.1 hypothetical protein BJ085DRAFT_32601 [Dimargaris cristalligena]